MPANLLNTGRDKAETPPLRPREQRAPVNVGRPLQPAAKEHAVSAERVMLAVLFADVSDSTRLYEQLGDTGAFGQIKDCMQTLADVTTKFGGWVVKNIGDGMMCAFQGADSAALAACEMQKRIAYRPPQKNRSKLSIRVGFHCGYVLREGQEVFGDTVHIAGSIASMATASHIAITAAAAAQLSPELNFRVRKLAAMPVKGNQQAIDVHEIAWQDSGVDTHLSGRPGAMANLVEPRLHISYQNRNFVFRDNLKLGRDATNDVVIEDPMASRNHARIEKRKEHFVLIDTSTNGTYVTFSDQKEIAVRRSEFMLYGEGRIAFGDSPKTRPDVAEIRFRCELPGQSSTI